MFLEVKFTQKLNVRPSVKTTGLLDVQFRQTAVQTDAVRTQLVVLSFGNSTASGGGVSAKHAATHFEGGSDELKPYDIGAALKHGDLNEPFKSLKLIAPFVSSPEFLAAMLGYGFGGYVDEHGESHLWADHLHGRVSFETLEMRYRKLLVSGEDLLVSSGGVVDEVLPYGQTLLTTADGRLVVTQDRRPIYWPSNGRVVFRLKGERGIDLRQFEVDDILRYTWRDTQTGNAGASGWLRVKKCFDTFWVEGEVVSGSPEWLKKGMTVGQFGNYTKKYRQGFINLSARDKHIALWDEVNDPILKPSMLKAYLGDLRYVTDPDFPELSGFGLYSQNAFLKGVFVLKSTGKTIETEFSVRDGQIKANAKLINAQGDRISMAEAGIVAQATSITNLEHSITEAETKLSAAVSSIDGVTGEVTTAKAEIIAHATSITDLTTGQTKLQSSIDLKADIVRVAGLLNVDGTIKTDKLVADGATITRLHAVNATIEGNITANGGHVLGDLQVGQNNWLTPNKIEFKDGLNTRSATLGDSLPATAGQQPTAMFRHIDTQAGRFKGNVAIWAEASGAPESADGYGNHALFMPRGDIAGFAIYLKRINNTSDGITLENIVSYYSCYNDRDITVYLPAPWYSQVGKVFYIKRLRAANVRITGKIWRSSDEGEISSVWTGEGNGDTAMLVNDGNYWLYNYMPR